jgi:beta-lactamase class A
MFRFDDAAIQEDAILKPCSMSFAFSRRQFIAGILAATATNVRAADADLHAQLEALQARSGGRLGVCIREAGGALQSGLNENERFAMCSTFKVLLAAQLLTQVDAGTLDMQRRIAFSRSDLLSYAPLTTANVAQGSMTVAELCAGIVEVGDNTAANLLLPLAGGPEGLTQWLRKLGDDVTRLDRIEPDLNTNIAGDLRDTTTPAAMTETLGRIVTGNVLSSASRKLLSEWLVQSSTGTRRIRAGLPTAWRAGDKTGTGVNGAVNDVAIIWPPGRAPLVAAIYMSDSKRPIAELEQIHAQVGRLIGET